MGYVPRGEPGVQQEGKKTRRDDRGGEGGGRGSTASRESAVPPVANLVTRARISADLYRRQLRPVPVRPGRDARGVEGGEGGKEKPTHAAVRPYERNPRLAVSLRGPYGRVELYKDEKLMQDARASERASEPAQAAYRLLCPNPQSLRALMTARHDPPGKILGRS